MTDQARQGLSFDEWDEENFPRPERCEFDEVVDRALSRRGFLGGVLAFGSGAAVMGTGLLKGSTALAREADRFPFEQIAPQTDGAVHVPEGYSWKVLVRWGDPLFSDAPTFDPRTGIPTEGSDRVFGENTDGMELFEIDGREILVVNSEYTNNDINLVAGAGVETDRQEERIVPATADDVLRLQNFQGVSVLEIAQSEAGWEVVIDSPYNRRITHNAPMTFDGPAAGHELLRTEDDASGMRALGTLNNCGSGKTLWGTYLTCEENFNGYFGSSETRQDQKPIEIDEGYARYGISVGGWGYEYHKFDPRFDTARQRNEPHRFGYVVEIDPANPDSTPVKHTALGRFKHENAEMVQADDGRVVVYMGDDERGEFIYRWVSNAPYEEGGDTSTLLTDGQLYVARFDDDMTGEWVALTPEATGLDAARIAVFTRIAASRVGATTMDRPEWIAANPNAVEGYCCLTNNSRRGVKTDLGGLRTNAGGDPMELNAPNPREANAYGQIVRWRPHGGGITAPTASTGIST